MGNFARYTKFVPTFSPQQSDLVRSIRCAAAYLRCARLSATPEEFYRLLWQPPLQTNFETYLSALVTAGAETYNGFVVFNNADRERSEERRRSAIPTEMMLRRARRAVRLIAWVPFVEAVFVCNSVGSETARPDSDIDWLVVTRPGRIWFVRAILNVILRVAGLRTYGNHEAGKMCLSFFIDTAHLDLAPLCVARDDVHFAYWLHQMVPIHDPHGRSADFIQANTWARDFLPHLWRHELSAASALKESRLRAWFRSWLERLFASARGNWLERYAERLQRAKLKPSLLEKSRRGDNGVVIAEGVLKFHERDSRRGLREAWLKDIQTTV